MIAKLYTRYKFNLIQRDEIIIYADKLYMECGKDCDEILELVLSANADELEFDNAVDKLVNNNDITNEIVRETIFESVSKTTFHNIGKLLGGLKWLKDRKVNTWNDEYDQLYYKMDDLNDLVVAGIFNESEVETVCNTWVSNAT